MTPNPQSESSNINDDLSGRTFAQDKQDVYGAQTNIAGDVTVDRGVVNTGVIDTGGGTFVSGDQYIGFTATEVITLIAEVRRQDQPIVWDGRRPYLGLTAFHEADAPFFFGREAIITDLLLRVQQSRFVCIAGPSGSGKSSLAQAGLLHALRQGKLPESEQWRLGDLTPKGNPLEQLARTMARLAQSPTAAQYLRENGLTDPLALHVQVDTLLSSDPRQRCVLLVDQFEELFTQTKDDGVRRAFIELLATASQVEEGRTIIILALRSDFISPCARYPTLRTCMNQQFQLVGAMEPRELALAITLPALEVGATLDPELVAQVIADMKGAPSALPLMQFALKDLFDATASVPGKPLSLTLTDYLKRGGVDQALQNHADAVFARLTTTEQQVARAIFTKLIEVGQGTVDTRRTAMISELVSTAQPEAQVLTVVNTLAGEKAWLLTTSVPDAEHELSRATSESEVLASAQRTVTIAHEKLIDAWPWLRRLVDENRELIALQSAIREDAQAWGESSEEESFLYGGARLARTVEQIEDMGIDLDALSARFINASVARQHTAEKVQMEARQREVKRLRQIIGGVLIALVLMSVAAYALYQQRKQIGTQNEQLVEKTNAAVRQSQVNLARQLATQAQTTPSELSLLLSIEAVRAMQAADTRLPEVEGALRRAMQNAPMALLAHDGTDAQNPQMIFNTDSSRLVTASRYGSGPTRLINAATGKEIAVIADDDGVAQIAFSPNGDQVMSVFSDTVRLFSSQSGEVIAQLAHNWPIHNAIMNGSAQNLQIATLSEDGSAVTLWAPTTHAKEPMHTFYFDHAVEQLAFALAGNRLVTSGADFVAVWNSMDGAELFTHPFPAGIHSAEVVGNGSYLVVLTLDKTLHFIDSRTGIESPNTYTHNYEPDRFGTMPISPDRLRLAAVYSNTIQLLDLTTAQLITEVVHQGRIFQAAFIPHPETPYMVSASLDGEVQIRDQATGALLATLANSNINSEIYIAPNGSRLAIVTNNHTVTIWEPMQGEKLAVLPHEERVLDVIFPALRSRVLTVSGEGTANAIHLWAIDQMDGSKNATKLRDLECAGSLYSYQVNSAQIALTDGERFCLWDIEPVSQILSFYTDDRYVTSSFSLDGTRIAAGGESGLVRLWTTAGGSEPKTRRLHEEVAQVVTDGAEMRLVTTGETNTVRLRSFDGVEVYALSFDHAVWPTANFDGSRLVISELAYPDSPDTAIYLLDSFTKQRLNGLNTTLICAID